MSFAACSQYCTHCEGNGPGKCDDDMCDSGYVFIAKRQLCIGKGIYKNFHLEYRFKAS